MSKTRLHDIYFDRNGKEQPSIVKCIEKLCNIQIDRRLRRVATYSRPKVLQKTLLKRLKEAAFVTIFKREQNAPESFPGELLISEEWTEMSVVNATAYRMRVHHRRYHDADRLEELAGKLLEDGHKNAPILRLLLYLSNTDTPSKQHQPSGCLEAPKRDEIERIINLKNPLAGDYPYNLYHRSYTLYPSWYFDKSTLDEPVMYPVKNADTEQDLLHAKQYRDPKFSEHEANGSLFGLKSNIFGHKGLTNTTYEFDSVSRLYGGLRHSRASNLDITLSYPELTGPINMMTSISTSLTSIDEGFVSPSASIEFSSDSEQDLTPRSMTSTSTRECSRMLVPYHGYRHPDYDLNVWKECLTVKRKPHRTWETLGLPAGSTQQRLYVTEAGSKVFDEIWQQRAKVIHNLASFLHGGTLVHSGWKQMDQAHFVKNAILVMLGVASDTFQFNKLGEMFLPYKNQYFPGVDPEALHSLLSRFAEWGTCFWRLLHFSAAYVSTPQKSNDPFRFFHLQIVTEEDDSKGVIFKAFAGAVRNYLLEYQHQMLSLKVNELTLQNLVYKVRRVGAQISYICQLCRCGAPDMPSLLQEGDKEFPKGVALLSYLYEEAVHCPEPNHYLALLYLLRKSCLPYLRFVQDWVFRGKCWDAQGEFMLRVNADYGGTRKDRQRWLKYVEPVNPDDPGSCVPSFLSHLANEIYTCGKTVALMQLICPGHFLGVKGLETPDLEITFSRRKLKSIEHNWQRHSLHMTELEKERITHWTEKEEELKASAQKLAVLARRAAEEERVRVSEERRKEWEERDKEKRKEFERLKKQAQDDAKRRAQAKLDEREEDIQREVNRKAKEEAKQKEEKRLLQEEKEKMISYYEELNVEAEMKMRRAKWMTERHRLHSERIKHVVKQRAYWQNEIKKSDAPKEIKDSLTEINTGEIIQATSISKDVFLEAEDLPNLDSVDDMLQDFVNVTINSQAQKLQSPQKKDDSSLDKALAVIRGNAQVSEVEFQAGVIGQGAETAPKCQIAPGVHHVSEETWSSPTVEKKPHKRMVEGKNVSDSHMTVLGVGEDLNPKMGAGAPSIRLVGQQRVTDSSLSGIFTQENESDAPVFSFSVRNVDGKNVSDSHIGGLLGMEGGSETPDLTPKLGKKLVPGHRIGDSSLGEMSRTPVAVMSQIRMVQDKRVSDSNLGSIFSGSVTTETTPKRYKKLVPGQGVSMSSVGELMSGTFQTSEPQSPRLNVVPDSTMGDILYGTPEEPQVHHSGRQVEGCSVYVSSVGALLKDGQDDKRIVQRDTKPCDSTMQNLLYGGEVIGRDGQIQRKKKVEGRHISESCIGDMMRLREMASEKGVYLNKDINCLRTFAATNRMHGGHHSQSSIQHLMYYEDSGPKDWILSRVGATSGKEVMKVDLKPAVNSPKFHPSYSTVQLLLYPKEVTESNNEEIQPSDKSFHLQLPPMDVFYDELSLNVVSKTKYDCDEKMDLKPTDLIGNVVGKSLIRDFEDDIVFEEGVDWKSDIDAIDMHALPVLLGHSVVQPIMDQVALANRCIVNYFMVDLELPRHFEMLRHFCFLEDGEFSQVLSTRLFEKIHSGCRPIELLNPIALGSLISQAIQGSAQRNSSHAEKLTFSIQHLPSVFSTNDPSSLDCFTLKYDIGWPCNIVVTESCQKRYGMVFGFLLKLKHIMWCLHDVGTKLTTMGLSSTSSFSESELRRLHLYRHEMQNFVKVMQGYVSTQVVHVCWHEFQDSLKKVKCLDDIHKAHVEYLRGCVFRCLLTKKTVLIMNVITDVSKTILRFWTQISSRSVSFAQLKQTYSNFQKYSKFLFTVVSKLVDRGYQPHLEDFLIRLNYNGFYTV